MKVVIGGSTGLLLSRRALLRLRELGHPGALEEVLCGELWGDKIREPYTDSEYYDAWSGFSKRNDPLLLQVFDELGAEAVAPLHGVSAGKFQIIEIPDDVEFDVVGGDCGGEYIAEKHRTWP